MAFQTSVTHFEAVTREAIIHSEAFQASVLRVCFSRVVPRVIRSEAFQASECELTPKATYPEGVNRE